MSRYEVDKAIMALAHNEDDAPFEQFLRDPSRLGQLFTSPSVPAERGPHPAPPAKVATGLNILTGGQFAKQLHELKGADQPFCGDTVRRKPGNVAAPKVNAAAHWTLKARDEVKECGLTRSVGTDHRTHTACFNAKAHLVDRSEAAKALGEIADLQERCHEVSRSGQRSRHRRISEARPRGA